MSTTIPRPLAAGWAPPPSFEQLVAEGRARQARVPRESLAHLSVTDREPMSILDAQDAERVPELVPLRAERMGSSAFAFFRGTAALMAADLSRSERTDLLVGSCGDAHVANFGLYASPQRTLVFDLNDFDESAWAPWEWDLKRLVTSLVIAGRASSRSETVIETAALSAVRTYAGALADGARRGPLGRYFERFDPASAAHGTPAARDALRTAMKDAEKRTADRTVRKLTTVSEGGRRTFVENPPTTTHVDVAIEQGVVDLFDDYVRSANVDIRALMQSYAVSDVVRRVVGVGSVGTRCYLILMQDGDGEAFVLQAKEAGASTLIEDGHVEQPEPITRFIRTYGEGGRVVAMQRILQAVSDPFLGHLRRTFADGRPDRHFYVRTFHDMAAGFDAETLDDDAFGWYADACAATLARAHGQSPGAGAIVGYIGSGRVVSAAILAWAQAYADLSASDWRVFRRRRGIADG